MFCLFRVLTSEMLGRRLLVCTLLLWQRQHMIVVDADRFNIGSCCCVSLINIWLYMFNQFLSLLNLIPTYGKMHSRQHYVIKFVSDLQQVGGFLRIFRFPPPIKMTTTICIEYTSPSAGFKLTTLVVIGTDCTGSCKSNYHTIITNTALRAWVAQWVS
jgi:hypothetical protein